MRLRAIRLLPLLALVTACLPQQSHALTIILDYSLTDTTSGFFSNAAAKAAVEAAAADISSLLSPTNLSAITPVGTPNVDSIQGASGSPNVSTATANWRYTFTNPDTGAAVSIESPNIAAGTIRIFVGGRGLGGDTLGQGGAGGAGVNISTSAFNATDLTIAVDNMEALSNAYMSRGAGPTIGTLTGTIGVDSYSLSYGIGIGQLWFDTDTNADADNTDFDLTNWHLDHTASVATGKSDLYSVALHEILHVLGVGTSQTWTTKVTETAGTDTRDIWAGPEAGIIVTGTIAGSPAGTAIIDDASNAHLTPNLTSWTLGIGAGSTTGTMQEVVMDPNLTVGTRKFLTSLDAAILRDLGYATVPEPTRMMLIFLALGTLQLTRRRSRSLSNR